MAAITRKLQNDIKSIINALQILKEESKDIVKVYWATGISTLLAAKNDGDAVTISTKLTKAQYVSGITMVTKFNNFFSNAAVTTGDYIETCQKLKYGNDEAVTILSESTEAAGDRLYQVSLDCIELFKNCRDTLDLYIDNEVGECVAVWTNERVVYGADMNKSELSAGITLVEQFKKMMNNEAVNTGDYETSIASWQHL